ncbi:MAG: hypothetical protein IPJ04_03390 [Candidatus Eisenbacteria bacterium]|nr:hypothetical protein [Candidatus Eisenbacteria bacterium]
MRSNVWKRALCCTLALCFAITPVLAQIDTWQAFLTDSKGRQEALPEQPAKLKDKEWLRIGYTAYSGFKPRLGVVFSEEKQDNSGEYKSEFARLLNNIYGRPTQGTNPMNHIEDLVRQAMGATNRFTMVERTTATEDVLGEQDFGASGRVDRRTAAQVGQMRGADYIVKATIIELNPRRNPRASAPSAVAWAPARSASAASGVPARSRCAG